MLTYPLQLYPAYELCTHVAAYYLGPTIAPDDPAALNDAIDVLKDRYTIFHHSIKAVLVIFTAIIACLISEVYDAISLFGAFAGTFTALIFPPLLELPGILENQSRYSCAALQRYTTLILGCAIGTIGTIFSLISIITVD